MVYKKNFCPNFSFANFKTLFKFKHNKCVVVRLTILSKSDINQNIMILTTMVKSN